MRSFPCPVDCTKLTVDLSGKTDWENDTVYYVVTTAGVIAGTAISKRGRNLILPAEQRGRWCLAVIWLGRNTKTLVVMPRQSLQIMICDGGTAD